MVWSILIIVVYFVYSAVYSYMTNTDNSPQSNPDYQPEAQARVLADCRVLGDFVKTLACAAGW